MSRCLATSRVSSAKERRAVKTLKRVLLVSAGGGGGER